MVVEKIHEAAGSSTTSPRRNDIFQSYAKGKGVVDLEKGVAPSKNSRADAFRKDVKGQFRKTFGISTKEEMREYSYPNAESNERQVIVDWLKKDVLSVPPGREEKIRTKVDVALDQWPVTEKLLRTGLQKQAERDQQVARYGELAVSISEKVFGSDLSSIKKKVSTKLNEPRTRLTRLEEENTGGRFATDTKPERDDLEQKIENSNISKEKITRIMVDALRAHQDFKKSLERPDSPIPDGQKHKELHQFAVHLKASAMAEINAIKATRLSDTKTEELKTAQHHTTHGVGLGNLLHLGEMIPGYASLALSALAEEATAKALKKQS